MLEQVPWHMGTDTAESSLNEPHSKVPRLVLGDHREYPPTAPLHWHLKLAPYTVTVRVTGTVTGTARFNTAWLHCDTSRGCVCVVNK